MGAQGRTAAPLDLSEMLAQVADAIQPISNKNYDPHPKQREFHCSDKPEKLFIGGNRSGKTLASVNECIWRLTRTHPYRPELNTIKEDIRGRFVGVSYQEGIEMIILPLFKKWMPKEFLIDMSWEKSWSPRKRTLTLNNGSFIEFMSYEQDLEKFAGTSRHFCAFDEEPTSMAIWQECKLRLLDTEGEWWISMTPVEGLTWVYDEIYKKHQKGQRPFTLIVEVNTDENPHLTQRGKDIAFGDLSEEELNTRKSGAFNEYTGRIYKDFDEETHVVAPRIPLPGENVQIYTSLDTGFKHPAVWLWHAVYPDGSIITFHEISRAETTVDQFAKLVKDYENTVLRPVGHNPDYFIRVGDPNGLPQTKEHTGTSIQYEYAKHGIYIGTDIPRQVDIGIIRVTQYLQAKKWTLTSDCVALIRGMNDYRWDEYASRKMRAEKAPKNVPRKKDDDEVDSLRYFFVVMPELLSGKIENADKVSVMDALRAFGNHGGATYYAVPKAGDELISAPTRNYSWEE